MTRHWKIGLFTVVLLFAGFIIAAAVDSTVAVYALMMATIVLGFAFGTAWIITPRTFSNQGDEASEWRAPEEKTEPDKVDPLTVPPTINDPNTSNPRRAEPAQRSHYS